MKVTPDVARMPFVVFMRHKGGMGIAQAFCCIYNYFS
jgi:hypothetical protein